MPNKYDNQHLKNVYRYAADVERLYDQAAQVFARILAGIEFDAAGFNINKYPQSKTQFSKFFNAFGNNLGGIVRNGVRQEWALSNGKNDSLVESIIGKDRSKYKNYFSTNGPALDAFMTRKTDGLNLSDRVWMHTKAFQSSLESAVQSGIGAGRSAVLIGKDITEYLQTPGQEPGTGVYRDPKKNAQRLARTETNMAYHTSDYERWQQLDFVIGFEVAVSNNGQHCPLCLQLQGKYPKWFKFYSWHPQCMCHATAILAKDIDNVDNDPNEVTQVPVGFAKWVTDNQERSVGKKQPYFVRDNFKGGKLTGGLLRPNAMPKELSNVPPALSKYENALGVTVDKKVFGLLDRPVPMTNKAVGAHFNPTTNTVNIPIDQRRKNSKWYAESVVYHEYGHAIDNEKGVFNSEALKTAMGGIAEKTDLPALSKSFHSKMQSIVSDLQSGKITSHDLIEQGGAFGDTLMSLDPSYGAGHSRAYFKTVSNQQREFIAHMFENKFIGNPVFKELAPDMYQETISLFDKLF